MRRILVPAVILAVGFALAGCSSTGASDAASSSIGSVARAPQPAGDTASGGVPAKTAPAADVIQRQVVTTGTLTMRTAHPISAGDRAAQLVDAAGGRVDDRTQSAATKKAPGTASLTLRIPSARLTDTLVALKKLGTVESLKLSTDDVTTQSEDLNARIKALQTSVDRLLALEAKASSTSDLLEIENDISDRQGDLDSLTAQQKYLSDQVEMSTISLRFSAPVVKHTAATPGPGDAFTAGLSGFRLFFTGVFLVLCYLVPWLVLAAVLGVGVAAAMRWRRKRRPATS